MQQEVLDLCSYMVACAEGLRSEPREYGSLRLLQAAARVAEIASKEYGDGYLGQLADSINAHYQSIMMDKEAFWRFVEELLRGLVREKERREMSRPDG